MPINMHIFVKFEQFVCMLVFPLVSLQQKKVNDNITQDGKLPKASVIFWIDLDKSKSNSGKTIRNVKAKVSINKEGKIKVLEYNKKH